MLVGLYIEIKKAIQKEIEKCELRIAKVKENADKKIAELDAEVLMRGYLRDDKIEKIQREGLELKRLL